jgi:glycosyltransferase involved in cell wall biosynthesis
MRQHHNIVFFADELGYREFLQPYVAAVEGDSTLVFERETTSDASTVARHLAAGKTLWFDQFTPQLIELTRQPRNDKATVICRLSGTDFLDHNLEGCRWEFFDRIAVSNPISADVLRDRFDRIDSHCRIVHLPPAVKVPDVELREKRRTKKLAYVGRISAALNSGLLLQCLSAIRQQHQDWKLYIIGEFESVSLRIYFEQLLSALDLSGNIEFNSHQDDLSAWYADKSYFVAPFYSSGQERHILEAMAHGLRPIVHNCFGASKTFSEKDLFSSLREFCSMVSAEGYKPIDQRRLVDERHNVERLLPQFVELLAPDAPRTSQPKVSILLPTYNRSAMLGKLLKKLARQTYANREIIVTDDCSTDDTEAVVKDMLSSRPDIVYHRNTVNQGNAANFGIAASKATGDYVLLCSDDDELNDDALSRFVAQAQKTDADIVYCDLEVIDGKGQTTDTWRYRNYYNTYDLLKSLMKAGGNVIPEVFLVKRKLFDKVYTETYARRFINTYYLPLLSEIKMTHLPEALYRYAVHQGSTFGNAAGLFDRCKSTQNFVNAALFMNSPIEIFGESEGSPAEQIANAYGRAVLTLLEHGKRHFRGDIYTGAHYEPKDRLFAPYFYNAYHWLEMAHRYGLDVKDYRHLLDDIISVMNPRDFDPVRDASMPAFYRRLPWFANKPFNNLSRFVALDIVTLGESPYLNQKEYCVHQEGKVHVTICNYPLRSVEQLTQVMPTNVVTVINVFDRKAIEPTLRYLAENQLFSVYLLNFTTLTIPAMEMLRNLVNVNNCSCEHFEDYLALLTRITTTEHYAHPHLQTAT